MGKIKLLIILLAVFVFCLLSSSHLTVATESSQDSQKKDKGTVVAYYFHGEFRCSNCFTIEQYSREAIEKYFAEQLKTKKLTFQVLNIDLPENEHFIKDYQLVTRSLVITEFKNGKQVRWTNLAKVWDYIKDRDAFYNYVKTEVQKYLEGR